MVEPRLRIAALMSSLCHARGSVLLIDSPFQHPAEAAPCGLFWVVKRHLGEYCISENSMHQAFRKEFLECFLCRHATL